MLALFLWCLRIRWPKGARVSWGAQLTMPYRQVKQEGCENEGQKHKVISHSPRVQRRPSTQVSRDRPEV